MNSELAHNNNSDLVGYVEAYCLFNGRNFEKILNKVDFESYLDGDHAFSGWDRSVPVVYVTANQYQLIQSAVMFYLPLGKDGYVKQDRRLPLKRLADTAGRGPNLGGGRRHCGTLLPVHLLR